MSLEKIRTKSKLLNTKMSLNTESCQKILMTEFQQINFKIKEILDKHIVERDSLDYDH